jgi:hypothetical protein
MTAALVGLAGLGVGLAGCNGAITETEKLGGGGETPGNMNPGNGEMSPSGGSPSTPGNPNTPVPNTPDTSPATPGTPDRTADICKAVSPGPSYLRRLTRREYDNTVRDLLGTNMGSLSSEFPPEELEHSFANAGIRTVSDSLAEGYLKAAEKIGKGVIAQLGQVLPCDPKQKSDDTCLDAFFDGFGKRLWRRPLEDDEKQRLRARFKENANGSFNDGLDAVVQIMALSPSFLYRTERGTPIAGTDYQKVAPYEMASRLSYLLWGSLPDADLWKAAETNALGTRGEVYAQARRMIADPRASEMVANFGAQWLALERLEEVNKDTDLFPDYKPELIGLFQRETDELMKAVWSGDAKLTTFLTAPYTYMNGTLAAFHGVTGVTGDAWKKVDLDPKKRVGVLSQGSVMLGNASVDQTSPIKRGLFIQDRFNCFQVPEPPPTVDAQPVKLDPKMTTRERFATHRAEPSCNACHTFIDPLGFAFENFDAIGKWRDKENGKDIDVSGALTNTDVDGPFNGAAELATKLASSKTVRECVATHWFRFAYGRDATDADKCTVDTLRQAFGKSQGDFRDLVLAITQTDAFMFRTPGGMQ